MYQYFSCASVSILSQKNNLLIEKNVYFDMNSHETGTNYRHSVSRKIKYCLFWWSVFLLYHTAFVSLSELGHFLRGLLNRNFFVRKKWITLSWKISLLSAVLYLNNYKFLFMHQKIEFCFKWQCLYMFASFF